ncbi:MAG TPA: DegT/DnrJ/EryC1/StrS aminotransferase family protein, partial [Candidatus Eisenbacteria bacterium]|nr:DegT/DnrJ/EryC1/StrS aminotransferase family protein [Candidatus Eisenbacteria bacterium]
GMIVTQDGALAERMRLLTLHGMSRDAWKRYTSNGSWYYEVVEPGYKANMTDIQAALGIHQLRRLDGFIEARRRYARIYDDAFDALCEIDTPVTHSDRSHIYHLYAVRLNLERLGLDRARFIDELRARNIGTSVHFIPVHLHPFYKRKYPSAAARLARAEALYDRIVSLPLYPQMTEADVEDVVAAVVDVVRSVRSTSQAVSARVL